MLKVGDKVRVVVGYPRLAKEFWGKVGTITQAIDLGPFGMHYVVPLEEGGQVSAGDKAFESVSPERGG